MITSKYDWQLASPSADAVSYTHLDVYKRQNYTNNPTMLEQAVKASLWQLAVYDEKELVAYIRLVGDGYSVIFVQDLLVRPDYQRQGIGRRLLTEALATFPTVYQRLLATERSEKNLAFYQSLGFVELSEQACTGMIYMK